MAIALIESAATFPHHIQFFHALAGGTRNGHRLLLHSNLDWGQDLHWVHRHCKKRFPNHTILIVSFPYHGYLHRVPEINRIQEFNDNHSGKGQTCYAISANILLDKTDRVQNLDRLHPVGWVPSGTHYLFLQNEAKEIPR